VTADIVEDGFGPDENGDPQGECFIRFEVDENGLFKAMKTLYDELIGGPFGGDDDSYDYWPSGALLLQAMLTDIAYPILHNDGCDSRPRRYSRPTAKPAA